jgi:hypothetical protein
MNPAHATLKLLALAKTAMPLQKEHIYVLTDVSLY